VACRVVEDPAAFPDSFPGVRFQEEFEAIAVILPAVVDALREFPDEGDPEVVAQHMKKPPEWKPPEETDMRPRHINNHHHGYTVGKLLQPRDAVSAVFAMVLTEQVPHTGGPAWDVVQHVSASSGASVVFAFEGAGAPERDTVRLRKLDPAREYALESPDAGPLGVHSGLDLMTTGIELRASARSRAHILVLHPIR